MEPNSCSKLPKKAMKLSSDLMSKGITENLVREISKAKSEPSWMLAKRLESLKVFDMLRLPKWGPSKQLNSLNLNDLHYYIRPTPKTARKWEDVPADIRQRYDDLGIPEDEKKFLAGLGAQYESEMVYHVLKQELQSRGVIFESMSDAVDKYPGLVQEYFGQLVSPYNNKFAALNTAVWSGGSFIRIPEGVSLEAPLHNFFQMSAPSQGQFERTIIVAEEGSSVDFIEGCVAPLYSEVSMHAGVVEIFVKKGARVKFSTMQNWSRNVWNLVTKRARIDEDGVIEWIDGNVGSGLSMKYPALLLSGKGASGRIFSLAFAGKGQTIDSGAKAYHMAPYTTSSIESKSVIRRWGETTFRLEVRAMDKAEHAISRVDCTSLILEDGAKSITCPRIDINNSTAQVQHESSILRVSDEQLLYLMSRGFGRSEAQSAIVGGFVEPFTNELPMEYAVEFSRLIELELQKEVQNA